MRLAFLPWALALLVSTPSFAYDSRLAMDATVNSAQLERDAVTTTRSGHNGDLYWADASAVLRVDADRLYVAAQDYDHYVQFGMPHLNESHLVAHDSPDHLFSWASLSIATLHSQHYLEVQLHSAPNDHGGRGMEWQLTAKRPEWPYPSAPGFTRSDGSFYLEPLPDGAVYVRYYLANDVTFSLGGLLNGIIQSQLRKGAADVIQTLARQAR